MYWVINQSINQSIGLFDWLTDWLNNVQDQGCNSLLLFASVEAALRFSSFGSMRNECASFFHSCMITNTSLAEGCCAALQWKIHINHVRLRHLRGHCSFACVRFLHMNITYMLLEYVHYKSYVSCIWISCICCWSMCTLSHMFFAYEYHVYVVGVCAL